MKKPHQSAHWVQPGVLRGYIRETNGQHHYIKRAVLEWPATDEKWQKLEHEVEQLRSDIDTAQQKWNEVLEEIKREREYLYQVVLTLKKEWEMGRQQAEMAQEHSSGNETSAERDDHN